jgi:hypothetical protein
MSGYDDLGVTVKSTDAAKSDGPNTDPRTLARLQDDARVDQAGKLLDWGKNNLNRFDVTGDDRVNLGEIDLGLRTNKNARDLDMLNQMADHFPELKGRKDAISVKDLQKHYENEVKQAQENEMARRQQAMLEQQQANARDMMKPLLATPDGNPDGSLFRVLDTIRDRKPDNEISKRDLEKYVDEYARRSRTGDIGSGQFTPESRQVVQNLLDNWNSPEVKNLRGSWTTSDNRQVTNSSITAESLAQAGGMSQNESVFGRFVDAKLAPRKEAPVVRSEMVAEITPPTHLKKFEADPRLQDQIERESEAERIESAQGLRNWGANNLGRYDITGDNAVNRGETDLGIRTTRNKESFHRLNQLQSEFDVISSNGKVVRQRDLDKHVVNAQTSFEANEAARQARIAAERAAAQSRDVLAPMMSTDSGHPNDSLFKVLDGIRGDVDDKIGKKDLKRFVEEYDWRSRNGDVGSGHYTPHNRAYVQNLLDNWDSQDVRRLRGTYTVQDNYGPRNSGRGTREVANSSISAESLRKAASASDLYAMYVKPEQK